MGGGWLVVGGRGKGLSRLKGYTCAILPVTPIASNIIVAPSIAVNTCKHPSVPDHSRLGPTGVGRK